jgi:uncharacterized surface protein with fasciclin (FAS1) repeats
MRKLVTSVAAASAIALAAGATAPAATADELGTNSLAAVLTSDGNKFDKNWKDYDIVTEAVLAVLAAKPDSAVGVLADGTVPLTAFVPNDRSFRLLVRDLTGKKYKKEKTVFKKLVKAVGVDTVEQVLLYHVVPGATIDAAAASQANGVKLKTARGKNVKVIVKKSGQIRLRDKDYNSRNARVKVTDINVGNVQIAHGVDRVLRPIDLPPIKH